MFQKVNGAISLLQHKLTNFILRGTYRSFKCDSSQYSPYKR